MLSLLLIASLSIQDQAVHKFAERYSVAFEEASARNVPVVILDFDGWEDGDYNLSQWYENRALLEITEFTVLILAGQHTHDQEQQLVDGEKRLVCAEYGGVPCEVHQRMLHEVFKDFADEEGSLPSPLFIVVLPDRTPVARFEQELGPNSIVRAIRKSQAKLGQGLGRTDYRKLKEGVALLKRKIDLKAYRAAWLKVLDLRAIPGNTALHKQLADLEEQLREAGKRRLAELEELWAKGQHLDALLGADELSGSFGKTPVGKQVAAVLKGWQRTPEGKAHARTVKNTRIAREMYEKGTRLDGEGNTRKALSTLRQLVKKFPESIWAEKARPLIEALSNQN